MREPSPRRRGVLAVLLGFFTDGGSRPGIGTESDPADPTAVRLQALPELGAGDPIEDDVDHLAMRAGDPDPDVRVLALETLGHRAELAPEMLVQRALGDPVDRVRAAAVRLAGRRGVAAEELFRLVGARAWPMSQQASLDEAPMLAKSPGLDDRALEVLLEAVDGMSSPPAGEERAGFGRLARSIGATRMIDALERSPELRLGAVRLLLEEGSPDALRAVSRWADDPRDEIRLAAGAAADALAPMSPDSEPGVQPDAQEPAAQEPAAEAATRRAEFEEEGPPVEPVEVSVYELEPGDAATVRIPLDSESGEMLLGLGRAARDPDDAVRERARVALRELDRDTVARWAAPQLDSGTEAAASVAGLVAEVVGLPELARHLLGRAVRIRADLRGPFVGALASFSLREEDLAALIAGVAEEDRPEAIRLMWRLAGHSLLSHVRIALEDPSEHVRMAALEVLGESGEPGIPEAAKALLDTDPSARVRVAALEVIGRTGLAMRLAALDRAMADPEPEVRATGIEILPRGMGREAAEILERALADDDERVRSGALFHLASLPEQDLPLVWPILERCPADLRDSLVAALAEAGRERLSRLAAGHVAADDESERALGLQLAGRAGTIEATDVAVRAVSDPAPRVRYAAVASLAGSLADTEVLEAFARALRDPVPEIRLEATRALGLMDGDGPTEHLVSALQDPEARVRETAAETLVGRPSPAVATLLADALLSPDTRRLAAELLPRLGDAAVEPLVDAALRADDSLAPVIGPLLERLAGTDRFLEDLGSLDPDRRLRAAAALRAVGSRRAGNGLIQALLDPDDRVRVQAVRALPRFGDEGALDAVRRTYLGDPVQRVVDAAEEALRTWHPREDRGGNRSAPRHTDPRT